MAQPTPDHHLPSTRGADRTPNSLSPTPPLDVLRKRADFLAAARAKHHATPGFVLQAHRRADSSAIRVGYTCSKKVGNAVARNRAKRRLREIARMTLPRKGLPGWDYVLIGRAKATETRPFTDLLHDLDVALARIHKPKTV